MDPVATSLKIKSVSIHILTTVTAASAYYVVSSDPRQAWQILAGSAVMGVNLAIIAWALKALLSKKLIALVMSVIVIKYALVFGVLIGLSRAGVVFGFPFALGVGAVFPTLIFLGYDYSSRKKEANDTL